MSPAADDERLAGIAAAFERACAAAPAAVHEVGLRLCGEVVRLRVAGDALAGHVLAPLAHLRHDLAGAPRLTIELWDARASGVAPPPEDLRHSTGRRWPLTDGVFATSSDARLVSHQLRDSLLWLDRARGHLVGWFADATRLTLHERARPLQTLLALWSSDRGVQAVHAAMVARAGRAALVPGASGSGKSTVALTCLAAGFGYGGDDWIGLGRAGDGACEGYGVYGSACIEPEHLRRLAQWRGHAIAADNSDDHKSLLLLAQLCPERLVASAAIVALVLPRITGGESRLRPASKAEAFRMLAPSSVFAMRPRPSREGVERLADLVERLPAWWLELGPDLDAVPPLVARVL